MKRILALVFVSVAGSCAMGGSVARAASTTPAAKAHAAKLQADRAAQLAAKKRAQLAQLAPADEYFGPLKLSIIGINNTIRDLGLRYDYNHDLGDRTYSSAELAERSVRDWATRYPHDDQVPHSIFVLQRLYTKILTVTSRDHAHVIAVWMFSNFGSSPQARQLRKTLGAEHLAPIIPPSPPPDETNTTTAPGAPSAPPPISTASSAPTGMLMPTPTAPLASPAARLNTPSTAATAAGPATITPAASPPSSPSTGPSIAPTQSPSSIASPSIAPSGSPSAAAIPSASPQASHAP